MTTWQEEQAARRDVPRELLETVAPLLDCGPWHVETPHDHNARLINADGVTLWANLETYGSKSGKVNLSVGVPDDYSYSDGDAHGLDRVGIYVSPDRPAATLARDISRRLIPAALDFWQAVSDRIARRRTALSARETLARELAEIMGSSAWEGRGGGWQADVPRSLSDHGAGMANVYGNLTPDYDGESARVELRGLTADQAREVARMIAGWAS